MEDVEREQLVEFIKSSNEFIQEIFMYMENDNYTAAAYQLGKLAALHGTLIDVFEQDDQSEEDCDEEYVNKCSEACEMMEAIRALHKQANQCRDGFKVHRENANIKP